MNRIRLIFFILFICFDTSAHLVFTVEAKLKSYSNTHLRLIDTVAKKEFFVPMKNITDNSSNNYSSFLDKHRMYGIIMDREMIKLIGDTFKGTDVLYRPLSDKKMKTVNLKNNLKDSSTQNQK